ncbi:hypothetical protein IscW_ISCW011350 [Ixodes scapularis]|uniref:Uncharacterized protein n=1 Tax=Ixodes scapularis TaxID=6945 RepID=B7Q9T6_IXOSC|nr:hypothetical protein IscW_ISCW011350 [Ixodes scapularis]|eukprot:XP_002412546.1 hypothetical protein IscW_ISCW011350 [Ixodes scapularis]
MPLCGCWPQRIPTLSGGSPALPIYGTPNHRPLCSSSECTESTCRYDRRRLTVIRGGARTRWSTGRCARATQASPRRGRWCFSSFAMVNNLEHSWHAAVLRRVHVGLVTFLGSVQGRSALSKVETERWRNTAVRSVSTHSPASAGTREFMFPFLLLALA